MQSVINAPGRSKKVHARPIVMMAAIRNVPVRMSLGFILFTLFEQP